MAGVNRRSESQRLPPRIADAPTRVENDERPSLAGQVVADRQTGLPAANHDRVKPFARVSCAMFTSPRKGSLTAAPPHRLKCASRASAACGYFYVEGAMSRCSNAYAVAAARLDTSSLRKMLADMPRDRLFAEPQRVADAPIRPARGNQSQDLQFAGGQTGRATRGFDRTGADRRDRASRRAARTSGTRPRARDRRCLCPRAHGTPAQSGPARGPPRTALPARTRVSTRCGMTRVPPSGLLPRAQRHPARGRRQRGRTAFRACGRACRARRLRPARRQRLRTRA